ncbi:MAG: FHA domain-containing protein [Solirubrobacteraceae bacterium]
MSTRVLDSHEALVVTEPSGLRGQTFALTHSEVNIGRAEENDVQLEDPYVSRHHAVLRRSGKTLTIEDAGSASGVLVNGVRATAPSRLRPGDRIRLGDVELELVGGEAESPSAQKTLIRAPSAPPAPEVASAPPAPRVASAPRADEVASAPPAPEVASPPPPPPSPQLASPAAAARFDLGSQQGGVISNVAGDQYNQQLGAIAPMRRHARWTMRLGFTLMLLGFAAAVVGFVGFSSPILNALRDQGQGGIPAVNAGAWLTAAAGSFAMTLGLLLVIISLLMKRSVRKREEQL